jgi:aminocarboxymuconate-semialdehyde decarboxylase
VYRPDTLANLIAVVGVEQVVAGSDYPFDMGEYALHELIESVPGLSETGIRAILGGNASRLLHLYPSAAL